MRRAQNEESYANKSAWDPGNGLNVSRETPRRRKSRTNQNVPKVHC